MSAAELELVHVSERDRIEQWRHEALERAGYDPEAAIVLAASHDVDLHDAVSLLERGCSVELALQILLSAGETYGFPRRPPSLAARLSVALAWPTGE
jgi:hypothetical protein